MMKNLKIAFIGGGNMAEGMISGMIKNNRFTPEQICVYDIIRQRVEYLENKYGIKGFESIKDASTNADILILAVRPQDVQSVGSQIKDAFSEKCTLVSICAGVLISTFEDILGGSSKIVRVMPNTLTQTQHGYSALCRNPNTTDEEVNSISAILESIGNVMEIKENMFDDFTAYSCAGPAYLLHIVHSMINAGVRAGFSRKDSRNIVIENMLGTALKLNQTGLHPYEIIDTMTSPGGVSIEAIYTLEQEGISGSMMRSLQEGIRRSKELA